MSVLRWVRQADRLGAGGGEGGAFGRDEGVEPADVAGHAVGGVLDDGAGVDVEVGAGGLGLAEALDELGAPALQQGEAGLGGEMPGEGQAEPEAAGVVGGAAARQQLGEELPAGVGDPVDLAAPPGPGGGVAAGPQDGQLAAQRARGGCRGGRRGAVLRRPRPRWPPRRPTSRAGSGPGRWSRTRRWPEGPGARATGGGSRSRGGRAPRGGPGWPDPT